MVVTGATSGIGLATARLASERGAGVMLVARNETALAALRDEFRAGDGRAEYAVADVADREQVERASAATVAAFGGYDSWINNAGAFIYGAIADTPLADQRRLVARAILHGCGHGSRDLTVEGAAGLVPVLANRLAPVLLDRVFGAIGWWSQSSGDPGDPVRRDDLYEPRQDSADRSTLRPFTRRTSLLLEAQLHPWPTLTATTGTLLIAGTARRQPRSPSRR